ncbi:hypothetical protein RRG08_031944, partial [Elysia crispata]
FLSHCGSHFLSCCGGHYQSHLNDHFLSHCGSHFLSCCGGHYQSHRNGHFLSDIYHFLCYYASHFLSCCGGHYQFHSNGHFPPHSDSHFLSNIIVAFTAGYRELVRREEKQICEESKLVRVANHSNCVRHKKSKDTLLAVVSSKDSSGEILATGKIRCWLWFPARTAQVRFSRQERYVAGCGFQQGRLSQMLALIPDSRCVNRSWGASEPVE